MSEQALYEIFVLNFIIPQIADIACPKISFFSS